MAKDVGRGDRRSQSQSIGIYDTVAEEGRKELNRPATSLWWSGVAAGIALSLSLFARAMFATVLPEADWTPAVISLGYSLGFVIVILGRLQLFTENTVTVILPLLAAPSWGCLRAVGRLWGIVFAANMAGTFASALLAVGVGLGPAPLIDASLDIARDYTALSALDTLLFGVPAGFMIAALVWMLPQAGGSKFMLVLFVTYFIGLGGFTHVVAGSSETFMVLLDGDIGLGQALFGSILPAFVGNVIGGTGLFALIAYGQISHEL